MLVSLLVSLLTSWWAVALEISWKSAAILAVSCAVSLLLRRAPAALRHAVWVLALGSLLLLPAHSTRSRVTTVHGTTINASINPSVTPAITAAVADCGVRPVDGGSRSLPAAVEKRNPAGRTPAQERCTPGAGCIRVGAGIRYGVPLAPSSDGVDRR
jgi:hypothetical protein